MRDISLGVKVTAARFDDATNLWIVETDRGESLTCTWLIHCRGMPVERQHPRHSRPE